MWFKKTKNASLSPFGLIQGWGDFLQITFTRNKFKWDKLNNLI